MLHPKFHKYKSIYLLPPFLPCATGVKNLSRKFPGISLACSTSCGFSRHAWTKRLRVMHLSGWIPCWKWSVETMMEGTMLENNTPQWLRWWYWYPHDQLGQPDLVWNLPECVQRRHWVHFWTRDRASFCRDSCSEHQEALWFMHTSRCSELWLRNVEEFKQTSGISTRQTAEILLVMAGVMRETSWQQCMDSNSLCQACSRTTSWLAASSLPLHFNVMLERLVLLSGLCFSGWQELQWHFVKQMTTMM